MTTANALRLIGIDRLRLDGGTQSRASLDGNTVEEYAAAITGPGHWPFPPIVVFYDGTDYWLADGFHRTLAAQKSIERNLSKLSDFTIPADIRQGTQRDAILYSVGANHDHGLRRTHNDKRRGVLRLLEDTEWSQWSDREIARRCHVTHPFVAAIRQGLTGNISSERTYTTKHGTTATMQTANIGKPAATSDLSRPVAIAQEWLEAYMDDRGRTWRTLEDNQVIHANSPCFQAFIKDYPRLDHPKEALASALRTLRAADNPAPAHPIAQSPAHPTTPRPTDNTSLSDGPNQYGRGLVPAPTPAPAPATDRRAAKIAAAASLPSGTYNVVLADPPWQYNNTGLNGAAANHYPTMPTRDLCTLLDDIQLDIADNAVLFLWATNPLLSDAFDIINDWGFTYKTNLVWVKDRIGTGFYVRGMHELLLIATRGAFTPIDTNHTPPITSVINAATQEHSRKPDDAYQIIEKLYPDCNYIELFARRPRTGWASWGNEVNQ